MGSLYKLKTQYTDKWVKTLCKEDWGQILKSGGCRNAVRSAAGRGLHSGRCRTASIFAVTSYHYGPSRVAVQPFRDCATTLTTGPLDSIVGIDRDAAGQIVYPIGGKHSTARVFNYNFQTREPFCCRCCRCWTFLL